MRDRAILTKFLSHTVPKRDTLPNFKNFFLFPKMEAILNFRIFDKNDKS